jgi:hypothetical protein
MSEVKFVKSKKEVIESVTIAGKTYELHNEYDICFDGGMIMDIITPEELKKNHEENGWNINESFSLLDDEDIVVPFEELGAQFVIMDGPDDGYTVTLSKDGKELLEL